MLDLAWTRWTATQIRAAAEAALAVKKERLAAIKSVPAGERTFENTIGALERADDALADLQQTYELLMGAHTDADIRQAAQETVDFIEHENVLLSFDRDLWRAAKEWMERKEALGPADRKLADDTIRDMRRMGFELNDDAFARLKAVNQELKTLESQFERTINEYEDHIAVTREQLAGTPENYVARLKQDGHGRYLVTLAHPDKGPFMQYAHDEGARMELSRKQLRKGGQENMARLAKMILLRQECARLLGYASHADFVTEIRMAKTGGTARGFVQSIMDKLQRGVHRELRELVDIKKRMLGLEKPAPINFHEFAYWGNLLRKEKYDLDSEEVRHYLPAEHVMAGIMDIYQELLGLRFEAVPGTALWDPSVTLYAVFDRASAAPLGHFALDLYPRKGKYGHYAAFPITLARENPDGSRTSGFVALVCNFPSPTPTIPSLLSHYETEALFHEFGHVMHALTSGGRWQAQNGFGVAMDFIEALSQIFEYWAWSPAVLSRISKHYQTGNPMPDELVQKILRTRQFMVANEYADQAVKAVYDLAMHSLPTDSPVDPAVLAQLYRDLVLQYQHMDLPEDAIFAAGWGHMADYDAGYYGYLWSKVYAADMFTRFERDPLDAAVGHEYRAEVLAPGASRDEHVLVEDFLGRPATSDALLRELGIQ